MAPLILNGTYKIRNAQYPNYFGAIISGGLYACEDGPDAKITNVGSGGNQIIIYGLTTVWTVVKVDGGAYYIQTEDGKLVWELPNTDASCENIFLVPHTGKQNTKWFFERVHA